MIPTSRTIAGPLEVLQREFDRAFTRAGDFFDPNAPGSFPVDIRETTDNLFVEAELPGFEKDQIDVSLENRILTIAAAREEIKKDGEHHLHERRTTRVSRAFRLPGTVDESNVEAALKDGILTLTLHKREEVKARKIEVK